MSHDIARWSALMDVEASCECGWESTARNALANAKRHADAHGHVVICQQIIGVTYAPRALSKDEVWERRRYRDQEPRR